jgi:hypothetical protein
VYFGFGCRRQPLLTQIVSGASGSSKSISTVTTFGLGKCQVPDLETEFGWEFRKESELLQTAVLLLLHYCGSELENLLDYRGWSWKETRK